MSIRANKNPHIRVHVDFASTHDAVKTIQRFCEKKDTRNPWRVTRVVEVNFGMENNEGETCCVFYFDKKKFSNLGAIECQCFLDHLEFRFRQPKLGVRSHIAIEYFMYAQFITFLWRNFKRYISKVFFFEFKPGWIPK